MLDIFNVIKSKFKPDAKQKAIESVLQAFKDMGAEDWQLKEERARLTTDDTYLNRWDDEVNRGSTKRKRS